MMNKMLILIFFVKSRVRSIAGGYLRTSARTRDASIQECKRMSEHSFRTFLVVFRWDVLIRKFFCESTLYRRYDKKDLILRYAGKWLNYEYEYRNKSLLSTVRVLLDDI